MIHSELFHLDVCLHLVAKLIYYMAHTITTIHFD